MSKRPPFWNDSRYGIKRYNVEDTFNGMPSLPNFIKTTNWLKIVTRRHNGGVISLTILYMECSAQERGWGDQPSVACPMFGTLATSAVPGGLLAAGAAEGRELHHAVPRSCCSLAKVAS